jgi:UDP-GlcNAc:undecaprenyl-phosphate GlcNAc-1-phosphate transferase
VLNVAFLKFSDLPDLTRALSTPLIAFCITALMMPFLGWAAVRTGSVDLPSSRKIHARPIPLLGGVGVYVAVVAALFLRLPMQRDLALMISASLLLMLMGVADDRLDLPSRFRLMFQTALALGLSFYGVRFHCCPWVALDHLVTILWIVGVINAMNCLDCADGAAGGTCLVVFGTLAAVAAANARAFVCQAALAGAGAAAGFLLYNMPPARVFLGDAGSTFLGLMAAVLAILAGPRHGGRWELPIAGLVLVVPVIDIVWVHLRRYRAGLRCIRDLLASTGKDHLPHRLMARGLSQRCCMGVMVLFSTTAAVGVLAMAHQGWVVAALAMAGLAAALWRVDRNSRIVIRPGDQVSLYHVGNGEPQAERVSVRSRQKPGIEPQWHPQRAREDTYLGEPDTSRAA